MSLTPRLVSQLQQALAHHQAGRLETARTLYEQVRRAAPRNFDAWHLSGVVALQQGKLPEAERLLAQAVQLDPSHAVAEMRLAMALLGNHQPQAAELRLRRLLARRGAPPETALHLARALRALGRLDEARAAAETAARVLPTSADAQRILAATTADLEGFAAAVPALRRVAGLAPNDPLNWSDLGVALTWAGQLAEATEALQRALQLDPRLVHATVGLGFAHQQAHRIREAVTAYGQALAQEPKNQQALSARLLCLHYLDEPTREEVFQAHREFGAAFEPAAQPAPARARREIDGNASPRLRVGFLSADFRRHSVAYFIDPILRHLDRNAFEIFLYHDHHQVDNLSAQLRSRGDHWCNFVGQPAEAVEARLRQDQLDLLVDLGGHTGFNRLPLFARRLAPVQITYLGYPDTTGLLSMDYRFVDAITDPDGDADRFHTERLVRFAPTAWAYDPPAESPEVTPPPSLSGRPVTFGSFNTFSKISDRTLRLWGQVLDASAGSRLLLKAQGLDDTFVQEPLRERLGRCGIDPSRVELLGRTQGLAAHLASYARVDVALDPLPYSGTTTTCEALWMGRPVVTLAGDRHARRVSTSLVHAIGHPEWAAADEAGYLAQAIALGRDASHLQRVGQELRSRMRASPLCDHRGQAARFGAALERCWQEKARAAAAAA